MNVAGDGPDHGGIANVGRLEPIGIVADNESLTLGSPPHDKYAVGNDSTTNGILAFDRASVNECVACESLGSTNIPQARACENA
jgi:hypothetical protein